MEHGGRPFEWGVLESEALDGGYVYANVGLPLGSHGQVVRWLSAGHLKFFQERCPAWALTRHKTGSGEENFIKSALAWIVSPLARGVARPGLRPGPGHRWEAKVTVAAAFKALMRV